jgi:hypothetical protein
MPSRWFKGVVFQRSRLWRLRRQRLPGTLEVVCCPSVDSRRELSVMVVAVRIAPALFADLVEQQGMSLDTEITLALTSPPWQFRHTPWGLYAA